MAGVLVVTEDVLTEAAIVTTEVVPVPIERVVVDVV
jgi:hypothetical protein